MYSLRLVSLLALVPLTLGQGYGTPDASTTSASTAASATPATGVQVVNAGQNGLSFSPNSISAPVGSMVEFHFFPPSHSVAQSSFSTPCAPPANGSAFWSGFITSSGGQNSNVFRITINDTNPIWFYCAIPSHCQGGMTGVINPPTDPNQSLSNYQAAAAKVANSVQPSTVQGGVVGAAATATTSGAAASSTSKPSGAASIVFGQVASIGMFVGALSLVFGALMAGLI